MAVTDWRCGVGACGFWRYRMPPYGKHDMFIVQRQGCVHGEELQFVLGAPLAGPAGLRFSPQLARNFTRPEQALAETVMDYWANFAATG